MLSFMAYRLRHMIILYSYSRYIGNFTTVYGYYDTSYKYQLSLFDDLRHAMTLARAGFKPSQRGHICSSARRSNHSATGQG